MLVLFSLGDSGKNLTEIYDRYADMLYRLALTQLGTKEDAEDAVHDVFAKYISAAPVFRDETHEKAWFIRVTVNRCHDIFRHRSKRNHLALDEAESIVSTILNKSFFWQKAAAVSMSERQKQMLNLFLDGYEAKIKEHMKRIRKEAEEE